MEGQVGINSSDCVGTGANCSAEVSAPPIYKFADRTRVASHPPPDQQKTAKIYLHRFLEGQVGFEPTTNSLRGRSSTAELLARSFYYMLLLGA